MANPWDDDYSQPAPETVVESGPRIIGQSKKSIFGGEQARAAGFAGRMIFSNTKMNEIENGGFDPVNFIDVARDNLPFVPEWLERMRQSTKYKLYNANKINFSTAQLRRETGAVINDSEIVWINETYFPQLGDGPEVAALKMEARTLAIEAMETEAGEAYQGLSQEETQALAAKKAKNRAIKILRERAKNNPQLADEIRKILKGIR
jgi:hypothetical protein|tara:strand:+ start:76 stop:693 length:618 start_codon:yes stop_codon:yes gene_type:complete